MENSVTSSAQDERSLGNPHRAYHPAHAADKRDGSDLLASRASRAFDQRRHEGEDTSFERLSAI